MGRPFTGRGESGPDPADDGVAGFDIEVPTVFSLDEPGTVPHGRELSRTAGPRAGVRPHTSGGRGGRRAARGGGQGGQGGPEASRSG